MPDPQIPASLWKKAAAALMGGDGDNKAEAGRDEGKSELDASSGLPADRLAPAFKPLSPISMAGMGVDMPAALGGKAPGGAQQRPSGLPAAMLAMGAPKHDMGGAPPSAAMSKAGGKGCMPDMGGGDGGMMGQMQAMMAMAKKPENNDDDEDDDSDEDEETPNPAMMLMMLKTMQTSVMQNMAKAPPEMQEQQQALLQMQQQFETTLKQKMGMEPSAAETMFGGCGGAAPGGYGAPGGCGASSGCGVPAAFRGAGASGGSNLPAAMRKMGDKPSSLPAALANRQKVNASSSFMGAAGNVSSSSPAHAMPGSFPGMTSMQSAYMDPSQKGIAEAQQEAMEQAAKEFAAAQEAAAAQQAAYEAMDPEQREAVMAAMNAASEAQEAQQKQFHEAMKAHEIEKLQKSGFYQSHTSERFREGYRPLRMCKHFQTDQCWRGDECTYAHSLEELHPASPDLPRSEVKETSALAEQQKVEDSAPDVRLKKKKELCNKWKNGQDCVLGRACPYAHGEKELGVVELVVCGRVKTRICKFWTTGNCMFLGNCVNAHGEKELGTKLPDFLTPPTQKRREGQSIDDFKGSVLANGKGKGKGKGKK